MKELHVIFGTGPLGSSVAKELLQQGYQVRMVNRSGQATVPGTQTVAGDAYSLDVTRRVTEGAAVVYQCAQPAYHRWAEEFPALQGSILEGAAASKARLVIADNLYMYGDPHGRIINESSLEDPYTKKGRVRKAMADAALAAHQAGRLQVALSRPSHYFGPGYVIGGDMVFKKALQGKAMLFLGRLDLPHSFSYVPDAGRAMAILGTSQQSWGQIWVPPVQPALTQLEFARKIWQAAGQPGKPKAQSLSRFMTQLAGLLVPAIRESVEMLYEFEKPYVVDSSRFEKAFGVRATPTDEAIRQTMDSYRPPLKSR
uniref:NAD-dependent epimerase/dehydratase family protein n=1 Tax=uncultured Meiothermus sp. TaxID=157471 RepID=UPI00263090CE